MFKAAVVKIDEIYMMFYNHIEEGKLDDPDARVEFDEGHAAITAQSRVFSKGRGRGLSFSAEEDPDGKLQGLATDGYIHGEDNKVMLQERIVNPDGTIT